MWIYIAYRAGDALLPTTQWAAEEIKCKKESIPVRCLPPALHCTGDLPDRDPIWAEIPWTETPLDRDPLDRDPWTETPRKRPPQTESPHKEHGPRDGDPLEGTWDQASRTGSDIIQKPPCEQNDWQIGVKTLPFPKLRLRAVKSQCSVCYSFIVKI